MYGTWNHSQTKIMNPLETLRKQGPDAEAALLNLKLAIASGQITSQSDCRGILEAACALSVTRRDRESLHRNLIQLKPYGPTDEMYALELLLLLVDSKLSDFFALLEAVEGRSTSIHIAFVVNLERNLTEGSYHKALNARKDSTSSLFVWLLEDLEHTSS